MESIAPPSSLLTHIALPVRDLDATLAFYAKYTTMVNIHERIDPESGLRSISHLGISLETRDEVDQIAAMAKADGCLLLGPMYRNEVVGYICIVTDPDGNNIEFSVEQVLG